jgi:hypothetical protein
LIRSAPQLVLDFVIEARKEQLKEANQRFYERYGSSRRDPEITKAQGRKYYYKSIGDAAGVAREQELLDQLRATNPPKRAGRRPCRSDEERLERRRATLRKHRYRHIRGVSENLREPSCCPICGSTKKLCMDHSHATAEFRGWLCDDCNLVLGRVKENPAILRALADYLEKSKVKKEVR